jgi:primosomal protein N''
LDKQTDISQDQVQVLVENLLAHYDTTMREKSDELSGVLSFGSVFKRSISSIFSKKQSIKEWLTKFSKDLESDLNSGLRDRLNDRVMDLAESIQQMGQIIDLKIRGSKTVLKDDDEIFSDIAERRSQVLTDLRKAFSNFLKTTDNFTDEKVFAHDENLSPTLATGSGIAVVGVILAAVANGMVFDITGGVLTAVGIIFAGVSLGLQKRKIMRNFNDEIQKGRGRLEHEVTKRLKHYVEYIREKIDANFHRFDEMLSNEKNALVALYNDHKEIIGQLNQVETEIHSYLEK